MEKKTIEDIKISVTANEREPFQDAYVNLLSSTIYAKYSFYGFILSKMVTSFTRAIPTAGAGFTNNNYQLLINPDFFNPLPLEQRMGILLHEAMHVILKHIFRVGERDHMLFNVAADIALNQHIERSWLPEGAMYPETFKLSSNLTAEQYYELLKEEQKKQQKEKDEWEEQNGTGDCPSCDGSGEKDGEECEECKGTGKEQGKGWPGPANGNPDLTGSEQHTLDAHDFWDNLTPEEQELAEQMMEKNIQDAMEKTRGNTPGNMEHILELWKRAPKISWKKVLKKYVSSKIGDKQATIKRRNRRMPNRMELKGRRVSFDKPLIIAGIDTSGSMSDEEIVNGLIEINEVCKVSNSTLQVVQIDTQINGVEEYDPKKKNFKRRGCGGTYMGAMAKYLNENKIEHDVLVMISDMEIEDVPSDVNWKNHKKPTLWLNTSGIDVSWDGTKGHKVMDISKA